MNKQKLPAMKFVVHAINENGRYVALRMPGKTKADASKYFGSHYPKHQEFMVTGRWTDIAKIRKEMVKKFGHHNGIATAR